MRRALDQLSQQLGAAEPLLTRTVSAEAADLILQLEASRAQARWYENEWHKAKARVEHLNKRLEAQKAQNRSSQFIKTDK